VATWRMASEPRSCFFSVTISAHSFWQAEVDYAALAVCTYSIKITQVCALEEERLGHGESRCLCESYHAHQAQTDRVALMSHRWCRSHQCRRQVQSEEDTAPSYTDINR
jgi:hypothetical protein